MNIDKSLKKMLKGKTNIGFNMTKPARVGMSSIDLRANKMLNKKLNFPKISSKPSKKDWDGDGILNRRDCQPRNIMRQDKKNITPEERTAMNFALNILSKIQPAPNPLTDKQKLPDEHIRPGKKGLLRAREYFQRPEVKEKQKEYHQRPEVKERQKEYHQRPEVKEKQKEYIQRPEVKERKREYAKKYIQRPEVKEKQREYIQRPEVKERKREYFQRPEVKERQRESAKRYYKKQKWKNMSEEQRNEQRQIKPDTDGDRIPDEYDCQPDNVMRQDTVAGRYLNKPEYYMIIDYVAADIKPNAVVEIPNHKIKKEMPLVIEYIKQKGLNYHMYGNDMIVVYKGQYKYSKNIHPYEISNKYGADKFLGYPKKSVYGTNNLGYKSVEKKLINKGIKHEDLKVLDFVPYNLTPEETKIEIQKRKNLNLRTQQGNEDTDGDGVINVLDCNPNKNEQDWNIKQSNNITYMSPTKFLKKTEGLDTPQSQRQFLSKGYFDIEKNEIRPIKELGIHIKSSNKKVDIPYLGEKSGFGMREHKGRHRAYAAELAGENLIPVRIPKRQNNINLRTQQGNEDTDGDGVINVLDCNPNNKNEQDFSLKADTPIVDYPESYGAKAKLVYMSPDEYMKQSYKSHGGKKSGSANVKEYEFDSVTSYRAPFEQSKATSSKEEYDKYSKYMEQEQMDMIKAGLHLKEGVVPVPWLETRKGKLIGQEGRHRAVSAREMGYTQIPVKIVETDKNYIFNQELNQILNKYEQNPRGHSQGECHNAVSEIARLFLKYHRSSPYNMKVYQIQTAGPDQKQSNHVVLQVGETFYDPTGIQYSNIQGIKHQSRTTKLPLYYKVYKIAEVQPYL